MFERERHRQVASILGALNATLLADNRCLFAGGTAIAMRYGEYRESVDIDFLVSDLAGYRQLRLLLTGADGVQSLASAGNALKQLREVRADQYGIRTMLEADPATALKFEIVLEARITLESPGTQDRLCGICTLTPLDMATSKLLANSDRWADDSAFSRDLIDLAMMGPKRKLLRSAVAKARTAYGDSITRDLGNAAAHLLSRKGRLERCMQALQMTTVPAALLRQRVKSLVAAAG